MKADKNFRIRKNNSEENIILKIESMDNINFFGFDLKIPRDELI
jgi:hypothetical protein